MRTGAAVEVCNEPSRCANGSVRPWASTGQVLLITVVTLAVTEVVLRVANPKIFREDKSERSLTYSHDPELGWAPLPHSSSDVTADRTIHAEHNSLGLRDIEFKPDGRPTMLFIGDSMTWGVDAEAKERFTDLLRGRIANYTTVNAGVSGFGTDQEYLWLQRLWPKIEPKVVVLTFCSANDRTDNSTNVRYGGTRKPYFHTGIDGALVLRGQPVPKSRQLYIRQHWLVHNLWLARLGIMAYLEFRDPQLHVPDPTERLVGKIRDFVEARGARLVVGLQWRDDELIQYLRAQKIPFALYDGAGAYSGHTGAHWTPEGHQLVADRLFGLLTEQNIVGKANASPVR